MSFTDCPACEGCGYILDETCPTCEGSSQRKITAADIELALSAKEWIDEEVGALFATWCKISGTHAAYGVESWSLYGDSLRIVQDTSCRGCHDTTSHDFPRAWLIAQGAERAALIQAEVDEKKAAEKQRRANNRQREIAHLQARLASLQSGTTA